MTAIVFMMLTVFFWLAAIFTCWIVIVRIIRRFVHFPIPPFVIRFVDNPIRRRVQPPSEVVDRMGIKDGMVVLEIGAGPGTFTFEAAKRVGRKGELFAVDVQPTAISRLNSRIQREKIENVTAKAASACELPFRNETFDRVLMITVLGEIANKKRALLEIKRVLKDKGILAIGEFLLDPDYPRRNTTINWCRDAGFELVAQHYALLHYILTFQKSVQKSSRFNL